MKKAGFLLAAAALIGACAGGGDEGGTGDSTQAAGMVANMISYADVAGTWDVNVLADSGDSVLMTYVLTATADSTGWTVTFPGRDPMPMHVMPPTADSIVVHMGPYESALRAGLMTTTTGVSRLVNGQLMGTFTAHYTGPSVGADSVMSGRLVGTKRM